LSLALSSLSFEDGFEIEPGGLDMSSPCVEGQLVSGWLDAEHGPVGGYRWAGERAEAVVRLPAGATGARLSYRLPPRSIGGLTVSVSTLDQTGIARETELLWQDGEWHENELALELESGDYLVRFQTAGTWSNPEGGNAELWPESRTLGFAVASLQFQAG
jgi:hypothetical protein